MYYGFDYVAQIGTLLTSIAIIGLGLYLFMRLLRPIVEKEALISRVKFALYDKELENYCKSNGVDYSKIDIKLDACYKKKNGKLRQRLKEIEDELEV